MFLLLHKVYKTDSSLLDIVVIWSLCKLDKFGVLNAEHTERIALLESVSWASNEGCGGTGSKEVAWQAYCNIIEDVKFLLNCFGRWKCNYINSKRKSVADILANFAKTEVNSSTCSLFLSSAFFAVNLGRDRANFARISAETSHHQV